jgi:hypothetical protein
MFALSMMRKMQKQLSFSLSVDLLKISEVLKCKLILFIHIHIYATSKKSIHICNTTGSVYLSGSATCHWYFNPTIPEAEPYYIRYKRAKKMFLSYFFFNYFPYT